MNKADIPFLTVAELSTLIEQREVSPVEVTQAYLARIDDLDFKLNAYLTVCRNEALEAAREAERAISQGNYLGPDARHSGGGEGPVLDQGHTFHRRLSHLGELRAR